jgi:hypothetical protein
VNIIMIEPEMWKEMEQEVIKIKQNMKIYPMIDRKVMHIGTKCIKSLKLENIFISKLNHKSVL